MLSGLGAQLWSSRVQLTGAMRGHCAQVLCAALTLAGFTSPRTLLAGQPTYLIASDGAMAHARAIPDAERGEADDPGLDALHQMC